MGEFFYKNGVKQMRKYAKFISEHFFEMLAAAILDNLLPKVVEGVIGFHRSVC